MPYEVIYLRKPWGGLTITKIPTLIRFELINRTWHLSKTVYFCIIGSVLQLTINFTPEYNRVPPVVKFTVVPFHPNGKN
jgi:hypothetical protein